MSFTNMTKKEWKEHCNELCLCGHLHGEHSQVGGCSHKLEAPKNEGIYHEDLWCDCKEFDLNVEEKEK